MSSTGNAADRGSWWEGVRLVAGRSISEGIRSRTIRITTLVLLIIGLGVVFLPRILSDDQPTYTLATVGAAPEPLQARMEGAGQVAGFDVDYLAVDDRAAAEDAVRDGDATVALAGDTLYVRTDAPGSFPVLVSQAVVADESAALLREAGLTPGQIAALATIPPPDQVEVGPVQDAGRATVGFVVGIVLYMAIMFAGQAIAMNVGMEKSTRIAEVLLAVLRPSQILTGSVIGIGTITLVQLLVLAVPIMTAVALTSGLNLPTVATADIGLGVTWFLLGYLVYAFVFAGTASLVDKMTEVGSAIAPVTVVLIMSYIASVVLIPMNPNSSLSVALSMFPLTAPMGMPIRWATGTVPVWELATSMALAIAAAVLLAWFGSSIYRRALVITGRKLSLREVLPQRG